MCCIYWTLSYSPLLFLEGGCSADTPVGLNWAYLGWLSEKRVESSKQLDNKYLDYEKKELQNSH